MQSVFQPEIQSWSQEKKCDWFIDCEAQRAERLVNALRLGLKIASVSEAETLPYVEEKSGQYSVRNYCTDKMYTRVWLEKESKIFAYFVVSKSAKFRPKIPKSEFVLGRKIIDYPAEESPAEAFESFRSHFTYFLREVVSPGKGSNWSQVVIGFNSYGHSYGQGDAATFLSLSDGKNEADGLVATEKEHEAARRLHANAFGLARTSFFFDANNAPDWAGGYGREFECY